MSTSDWALVALNVLTLFMAVIGLAAQDTDPMSAALALTIVTALVNGGWVLRRSQAKAAPRQLETENVLRIESADEMDIHRVLDIDQRLEALERAEERRRIGLDETALQLDDPAETVALSPRTRQRV